MNIELKKYLYTSIFSSLLLLIVGCKDATPDANTLLSQIQQEADIVTTELTIRKIAIYDSNQHEHISLTDPSTWKYGERKCIVPVEVTIKYGYDLREMTMESIKIDDESKGVEITLPEAKVIDSSYNTYVDPSTITSISTGLRDEIGHETIEAVRQKAYDEVMKEDFEQIVGKEIRYNAETVLASLVRGMGFKDVRIND
ncbi:MAG: DUF4230 domain-containing protein [Bacteroidaceae bacterium]|nr:DUF4230 domain-containing protein [Bacteroidaceae bacterium]